MPRPFDASKFRKAITKGIDGISVGFHDPKDWISTGNYTLNYLISGDFNKGVPLGKVAVFAGESGSGKSFVCSGNLVKNAQDQGCFIVLLDSENALDDTWLQALGVKTDEENLLKIGVSMIDDVAKIINEFMKGYRDEYAHLPYEERQKVLFVVDSLGMLLTPTDVNQFEKGDMKGDMGRKPKALLALVRNTVNMIAEHPVGFVATAHSYASQDMFDPDPKIAGGSGFVYASSIMVAMRKLKLKEDENGNKVSDVRGIRAACKIMKTRYSKPFESVQIKIPYESGMSPVSGLLEMCEAKGIVKKQGNRLSYISKVTGEETIEFRKNWTADKLQIIMDEWDHVEEKPDIDDFNSSIEDHDEDGDVINSEVVE